MLTMVDARNNLSRQVEDEVRSHFGERVFTSMIPRNVRLSEAPSHGKPILLYDIHSRGAVGLPRARRGAARASSARAAQAAAAADPALRSSATSEES